MSTTAHQRRSTATAVGQPGLSSSHNEQEVHLASVDEAHWLGRLLKAGTQNGLLVLTIVGAAVGLVAGWAASVTGPGQTVMEVLGFPGEIFLRMLRVLVVPLIMSSIVVGITSLESASNAGRLSARVLLYYGATTMFAASCGVFWVLFIQPGLSSSDLALSGKVPNAPQITPLEGVLNIIRSMFPPNLVAAAADMNILGLITFSVALGIVLVMMGEKGRPVAEFFESLNEAIMRIVGLVMWVVPIGICSLIVAKLGQEGNFWSKIEQLSLFVFTVTIGLAFHMFVFLPCIYLFIVRKNPFLFMYGVSQALLIALGTASSSATLPITIKCCEENNGISQRVTRFVLPLGATINMNGTALYEAVAAIFVAQTLNIGLSFGQVIIVALTATLAAVGAAGIPEAGLVTLIMVLAAVGLPLEGVGLLLSIDWFLDRLRTTVNVFGDSIGAAIVHHWEAKQSIYEEPFTSSSSKEGSSSNDEDAGMMSPILSSEHPHYHT